MCIVVSRFNLNITDVLCLFSAPIWAATALINGVDELMREVNDVELNNHLTSPS